MLLTIATHILAYLIYCTKNGNTGFFVLQKRKYPNSITTYFMYLLRDKIMRESGPVNENTQFPAVVQLVEPIAAHSANQMLKPLNYVL